MEYLRRYKFAGWCFNIPLHYVIHNNDADLTSTTGW